MVLAVSLFAAMAHLAVPPPNKHAMIVLCCRSGRMNDSAAQRLVLLGFTNIQHLAGGTDA